MLGHFNLGAYAGAKGVRRSKEKVQKPNFLPVIDAHSGRIEQRKVAQPALHLPLHLRRRPKKILQLS